MALSFTNLTSGESTSNGSSTASISQTSGTFLLLTAVVTVPSTLSGLYPTLTVSGDSRTWTAIQSIIYGDRRCLFVLKGTGAAESGSLTLTFSGSLNGGYQSHAWIVDEVAGHNTTTPNDTATTGAATSGTSLNLPDVGTPDAGDRVFCAFGFESGADSFAIDGSFTEIGSITGLGNVRTIKTGYDASDPQDETPGATWGTSGNGCGGIAFIVNSDGVTYETVQHSFRWGADDGSESAHTWLAAENANMTQEITGDALLRLVIDRTS